VINFSKPTWIGTRILRQGTLDANAVIRLSIGKILADSKGDLTRLGFGWTIRGTGAFETQGFMGATLTKSTNGTTGLASTNAVDVVVYSDGTGNLTLFVNGTQTASSTGGPTGSSGSTANALMFEIENVALATAASTASCGQLYILQAD
jgi:negative regulator of sigma E activity